MKATKFVVAVIVATAMSATAIAYEAGDWLIRGRIAYVNPNDEKGKNERSFFSRYAFTRASVNNKDTIPELDITYMLSPNWGAELILGYSEHNVRGIRVTGKNILHAWDYKDVINTKVLPPTLTLQYHFAPNSDIKPYVGAGINYTNFFGEAISKSYSFWEGGALLDHYDNRTGPDITLKGSWGLTAQAGVDIALNSDWFVNLDVKYIDIDTTGKSKTPRVGHTERGIKEVKLRTKLLYDDIDIDPFVFGIGIGRKF